MVEAGGKEQQLPGLGWDVVVGGIKAGIGPQRSLGAHRHARHQFIERHRIKETQGATTAAPVAIEVVNRTDMGIGMVMAPHQLARLTHHWPTALNMDGNAAFSKAKIS